MTLQTELNKIFAAPAIKAVPIAVFHIDAGGQEWRVFKTSGPCGVWRSNGCRYDFSRLSDLKHQIKQEGGKTVRRALAKKDG